MVFPPVLRPHATTQTASFTAAVGFIYRVNVTTAQIDVTFPTTPPAGSRFGYFIGTQSTTVGSFKVAPGFAVEPNNPTINSAAYTKLTTGSAKWGLWMSGELLIFHYVDATVGWLVEYDGRLQFRCNVTGPSGQTLGTADTKVNIDTAIYDVGLLLNSTDKRIEIKRSGTYFLTGSVSSAGIGDGTRCDIAAWKNSISTGIQVCQDRDHAGLNTSIHPAFAEPVPFVGTDYIEMSIGTSGSSFSSIANTATNLNLQPRITVAEQL